MSDELLTKENKFYELNGELERKTKELMKEVNSVVNTTRLFDSEAYKRQINISKAKNGERDKSSKFLVSKYISDSTAKDFQSDTNLPCFLTRSKESIAKEIVVDDDNCDDLVKKRNSAIVRFFKSKAKILETELEAIKLEYKKKCDYSTELQAENKKLDEERVKLHGQVTALKETLAKMEVANKAQLTNLQKSDNENIALKKEIENFKKELKLINQSSSSYNIRLNRSLEDNDTLRKALKGSQLHEKELRDENRRLEDDKRVVIANLEKQRMELLHTFKKQMLLIDNLKKQKAYLEATMLIKYTEDELLKLLDWNLDGI